MTEEVYFIEGDHVYQDMVSVVFTDNIKESIEEQCRRLLIGSDKLTDGNPSACVCYIDEESSRGKKISACWALFDINKINDSIIVHECVHLCFNMLNKRGLKHKASTDEAYAYLTQWLFNKIKGFHKDLLKQQKLAKKKVV